MSDVFTRVSPAWSFSTKFRKLTPLLPVHRYRKNIQSIDSQYSFYQSNSQEKIDFSDNSNANISKILHNTVKICVSVAAWLDSCATVRVDFTRLRVI
jgi:hypothetical protein